MSEQQPVFKFPVLPVERPAGDEGERDFFWLNAAQILVPLLFVVAVLVVGYLRGTVHERPARRASESFITADSLKSRRRVCRTYRVMVKEPDGTAMTVNRSFVDGVLDKVKVLMGGADGGAWFLVDCADKTMYVCRRGTNVAVKGWTDDLLPQLIGDHADGDQRRVWFGLWDDGVHDPDDFDVLVGEEDVDGRPCHVLRHHDGDLMVWLDEVSRLPLQERRGDRTCTYQYDMIDGLGAADFKVPAGMPVVQHQAGTELEQTVGND